MIVAHIVPDENLAGSTFAKVSNAVEYNHQSWGKIVDLQNSLPTLTLRSEEQAEELASVKTMASEIKTILVALTSKS